MKLLPSYFRNLFKKSKTQFERKRLNAFEILEKRCLLACAPLEWNLVGDAQKVGNTISVGQSSSGQSTQPTGWHGAYARVDSNGVLNMNFTHALSTLDSIVYDEFIVAFSDAPLSNGGNAVPTDFHWGGQNFPGFESTSGSAAISASGGGVEMYVNLMLVTRFDTLYPSWGEYVIGGHNLEECVLDLDIDADNDNDIDEDDDDVEDIAGNDTKPGKVINILNVDSDDDGILDFVDGFDWRAGAADNISQSTMFVPLELTIPYGLDFSELDLEFSYDDSDPVFYKNAHEALVLGSHFVYPTDGKLRIWTKDGNVARDLRSVSDGGDFVSSGVHSATSLGITPTTAKATFYVETVNPSLQTGDLTIEVTMSGDDLPANAEASDQVRVTSTLIEVVQKSEIPGIDDFESFGFQASRLARMENDEEYFNGYLSTYNVRVYDPRASISQVYVHGQAVPLTDAGPYYTNTTPITVIRENEIGILQADLPVTIDYDIERETGYYAHVLPDDVVASPVPWTVQKWSVNNPPPIYYIDPAGPFLHVDATPAATGYVLNFTDPNYFIPNEDLTIEALLRINSVMPPSSPEAQGGCRIDFFFGERHWTFLIDSSNVFEHYGSHWVQTSTINFLDGEFHAFTFHLSAQGVMSLTVDGTPILSTIGKEFGSYYSPRIMLGDDGFWANGSFDLKYIKWSYPEIDQPPEYTERPSDATAGTQVITIPDLVKPVIQYNPKIDGTALIFSDHAQGPDKVIAKLVDEAVAELGPGWMATNPVDSGAYGKAVSDQVRTRLGGFWNRAQWKTGVLVDMRDPNAPRIAKFGANGGSPNFVEVDVMYFQKGYKPKVGDLLDRSKIIVYEIKSSASGTIEPVQLARLRAVQGADIKKVWTEFRWGVTGDPQVAIIGNFGRCEVNKKRPLGHA